MKSELSRGELTELIQVVTEVREKDIEGGYTHDYRIDYELYARHETKMKSVMIREKWTTVEVSEFGCLYNEEVLRRHGKRKVLYQGQVYSIDNIAPLGGSRIKRFMMITCLREKANQIV